MSQEIFFLAGWIVHIEQDLVLVLEIPFMVRLDVGDVEGVHVADEVQPVLI